MRSLLAGYAGAFNRRHQRSEEMGQALVHLIGPWWVVTEKCEVSVVEKDAPAAQQANAITTLPRCPPPLKDGLGRRKG